MRALGGIFLAGALAIPHACASATTITIYVGTTPELCEDGALRLNQVGIAVAKRREIDDPASSPLQRFARGCQDARTGFVASLVIVPNEDRSAEVAIRVVAGLDGNSANACDAEDGQPPINCVVTKRLVRFVEGHDVPVTVLLEPECVGISCPMGLVCIRGATCAPPEAIPITLDEPDASSVRDASAAAIPACVQKGGKVLTNPPTCSTSFAKDVLPALSLGGCQDTRCHGSATPPPLFLPNDAAKTYAAMVQLVTSNGLPLISPCSVDPAASSLDDVVNPDRKPDNLMPPIVGLKGSASTVEAWLACGSPDN
ncbi:MAG: hypothetical protein KIT84_07575 [Labilithrix sp.]|nr:hypothetical protein [Labilithrix sp.]MCW5810855.1 hypothetical protein [Labilithrix sp.]